MLLLREMTLGAAFLVLAVLWPLHDHQTVLAVVLGVIVGGPLLFIGVRYLQLALVVTRETVSVRNPLRTDRIRWAEVRSVRLGSRPYIGASRLPVFVFELRNRKVTAWSVPVSKPKQIAVLRELQERAPSPVGFPDIAAFREATRKEHRHEVWAAVVLVAVTVVLVVAGFGLFGVGGEVAATLLAVLLAGIWRHRHLARGRPS
jgi:hypothetical protein